MRGATATKTGRPDDPDVLYGPLNNAGQLRQVSGFIERLPAHAKIEAGGHRVGDKGYFYAPTVVSGLEQDDEIIQNEVFGPVISPSSPSATRHKHWTTPTTSTTPWPRRCGPRTTPARCACPRNWTSAVWINTHIPLVAEMPHGGFKQSGYGKDLSAYGFEDYTRIKHIMTSLDV